MNMSLTSVHDISTKFNIQWTFIGVKISLTQIYITRLKHGVCFDNKF